MEKQEQLAKELYAMNMGDVLHDFGTDRSTVIRVPGGWIFTYHFINNASSVFVPYSDEFRVYSATEVPF